MFTGLGCFWVELGIDVTELALLATELTAFFAKVANFLNQDSIINYVTLCHVFILLIPLNGLANAVARFEIARIRLSLFAWDRVGIDLSGQQHL